MIPTNGASMTDAANTRENEGAIICDSCFWPQSECGLDPNFCEQAAREKHGDDQVKARKEERV